MSVKGVCANFCARSNPKTVDSVDDPRSVLKARKNSLAGSEFVLKTNIRIEHRTFRLAGQIDSKQIGEREVLAALHHRD